MSFHEIRFPDDIARGARGGPERRTQIVELASGAEERNASWANSRRRFDVAYGIRRADDLAAVVAFFEARNGRLHGFRFRDWADYKSCAPSAQPAPTDQPLGLGDGVRTAFPLVKRYASGSQTWTRAIAKPAAGSVRIALDGTEQTGGWSVDPTTGIVTFDPALQAHLDAGATTLAWCWRLTRADGMVFGFTDHDRALVFDGTTFEPETGFTASELRASADLVVDAQDAEGVLSSDRITETDILEGRWDSAAVEVFRVNWAAPAQRVLLRRGAVGEIRRGRVAFVAEMRSLAHQLGQTVGRVFQGACDARLGDARCGVELDDPAYRASASVSAVQRARAFTAAGLGGFAAGWFTLGRLDWTAGANAGRVDEVRAHGVVGGVAGDVAGGVAVITLLEAPVRPIAPGDAFVLRAGCDKRLETCAGKFANVVNFRGFPHIPGEDVMLRNAAAPRR